MVNPVRIAHGFQQEVRTSREISEGMNPRISVKAASYLPVKLEKYQGNEASPVVILKGELIALDQWNQVVPANFGVATAANLAYGALDVKHGTVIFNPANAFGIGGPIATGNETATLAANKLIGYALQDVYANEYHLNYKIQTDQKGVGTVRLIEYPVITSAQAACSQGDIVVPDEDNIGQWRPLVVADLGTAAQSLALAENRYGKIMKVFKTTANLDKLDVVVGAPGYNLHATKDAPGGAGIPNHLSTAASVTRAADDETGGTSNAVANKYRVLILVRV